MTSRIQADGEGKEAKWADIDDDEDDWAPETIEWGDGTKVTLNQDSVPSPQPKSQVGDLTPDKAGISQAAKVSPALITTVGPNATVLKVGASVERQQAQKAAILQRPQTDRPVQAVSKAPAPPPSKSPWATLPPVDKVFPVTIAPQGFMPAPSSRYQPAATNGGPILLASSPAKEMSADDFNRSWRESPTGPPRELYVPTSGRYEAVGETRRRTSRVDQSFRAPAVLQRPNQVDTNAPAEPSAAFQTHRTSTDQAVWNRRRASSNLSGGSGSLARRQSLQNGLESIIIKDAQASALADDTEKAQDATANAAPTQLYKARLNSVDNAVDLATNLPDRSQPSNDSLEADIARQKHTMKEAREAAFKRRREEEEREEAARKERIRLKLEAMGPPPSSEAKPNAQKIQKETQSEPSAAAPSSPPKPPVPEATGGPKQYGLMKVHHPDNVKKMTTIVNRDGELTTIADEVRTAPDAQEETKKSTPTLNGETLAEITTVLQTSRNSSQESNLTKDALSARSSQYVSPQPQQVWPSGRVEIRQQPSANPWGSLSNDRTLGNGSFDKSLMPGFGPREPVVRGAPYPNQPWLDGRPISSDRLVQANNSSHLPAEDRSSNLQAVNSPEEQSLTANSEIDSTLPISKPAPIGPPQVHTFPTRPQPSPSLRGPPVSVAAWNAFHEDAVRDERAENERYQRELQTRREEELRSVTRRAPQYMFEETFKQVQVGDQAGQRHITGNNRFDVQAQTQAPGLQPLGVIGLAPRTESIMRQGQNLPSRGSRFFPPGTEVSAAQNRRAVTYGQPEVPRSPSPPPAEEFASQHPAYAGSIERPIIHLPTPKAIVKLPPKPSTPPPPEKLTFAAAVAAAPPPTLRAVSTPIAQTPSWQTRFDGLLGRSKQVAPIAPVSKEPLEAIPVTALVSVSLPQIVAVTEAAAEAELATETEAEDAYSKDVELEEEMFEDREAGSLPMVRLPQQALLLSSQFPERSHGQSRLLKAPRTEDPFTIKPFMLEFLHENSNRPAKAQFLQIRLPGQDKTVKKDLSRTLDHSKSLRQSSSNFSGSRGRKGPPRLRNVSGSYSPHDGPATSGQASPSHTALHTITNGPRSAPYPQNGWRGGRMPTGVAH